MKRYFLHGIILFFLLACGKDSKPEQQEYITIGGLFPLTGELCNEGIRALNGLQLARNVLNKKGGILGKQLDIIVLDDKNDVQYAIEQYKALKEKGVIAIIGSSFPEVTQALAEAAEKDSMPIISPMIVNPAKAKALASFAYNTLNARTALILDNSKYTSTTNIFEEEFKLKGGKVLSRQRYSSPEAFETILEEYKSNQPDIIFCPTHYIEAAQLVEATHKLGFENSKFIGTYAWEGILGLLHEYDMERVFYASPFMANDEEPDVKEFSQNFFESFNQMPMGTPAVTYSSVQILAAAIESSGSTNAKDIMEAMKTVMPDVIAEPNPKIVYIMQVKNNIYSLFEKINL